MNESVALVRSFDGKPINIRKDAIIALCQVDDSVVEIHLSNGNCIRVYALMTDLMEEIKEKE